MRLLSFRPLDGESISKHYGDDIYRLNVIRGFRPLDGESISKQDQEVGSICQGVCNVSVP